jgi:hypothetical protein
MATIWRVAPDAADDARVEELAQKEFRPVANMVKVLIHEALFARQLAEGKAARRDREHADLVAAIRDQAEPAL